MDKLYIVTNTSYYGPTLVFRILSAKQTQIEEYLSDAYGMALDVYEEYRENDDVPTSVLYESITIDEVSTIRPVIPGAEYFE